MRGEESSPLILFPQVRRDEDLRGEDSGVCRESKTAGQGLGAGRGTREILTPHPSTA
jgi:hypothetical protein